MRQAAFRIQKYDQTGNTGAIVREVISFLKLIVLFDNVYNPNSLAYQTKENGEYPFVNGQDTVSVPGSSPKKHIPADYNYRPYKAVLNMILRFADFFSVQSLTYKCANNLN